MTKVIGSNEFIHILQLAIGLLFAWSVSTKLRQPRQFEDGIAQYAIIPNALITPTAWLLIVSELTVAAAFITGWQLRVGIVLAVVLTLVFVVVVSTALIRRRFVRCLCFGTGEVVSATTMLRLAALGVGLVFVTKAAVLATPEPLGDRSAVSLMPELLVALLLLVMMTSLVGVLPEMFTLLKSCEMCSKKVDL